jgi:hypothetical protein
MLDPDYSIFQLSIFDKIGLSKPGALHANPRFHPQRRGRFAPLSFAAFGGKIQTTRIAGGR